MKAIFGNSSSALGNASVPVEQNKASKKRSSPSHLKKITENFSSTQKEYLSTGSRKPSETSATHPSSGVCVTDFIITEKPSLIDGRVHNKVSLEGPAGNVQKDAQNLHFPEISDSNLLNKEAISLSCGQVEGESINFLYNDQPPDSALATVSEYLTPQQHNFGTDTRQSSRSLSSRGLDSYPQDVNADSSQNYKFNLTLGSPLSDYSQRCPDEAFELHHDLKTSEGSVYFSQPPVENPIIGRERMKQPSPNIRHETADVQPFDSAQDGFGLDFTSSSDCLQSVSSHFRSVPQNKSALNDFGQVDLTHLVAPWLVELVDAGHIQTVCTALLALGSNRTRIHDCVSEEQVENWFYVYLDILSRFRLWCTSARIIKQCGSLLGGVDSCTSRRSSAGFDAPLRSILGSQMKEGTQIRSQKKVSLESNSLPTASGEYRAGAKSSTPLARHVAILNQTGTSMSIRCGKCSKAMQRVPLPSVTPIPPSITNSEPTTAVPVAAVPTKAQQQTQPPKDQISSLHTSWACSRHPGSETSLSTCAICHLTVRGLFLWCFGCSHGGHLNHMQAWLSVRCECPAGCGHLCEYGRTNELFASSRMSS